MGTSNSQTIKQGLPRGDENAQPAFEESKISTSPTLLAWCSQSSNEISVIDLDSKKRYATFHGASSRNPMNATDSWRHLKEVSNSKLLISLSCTPPISGNMAIFDISKRERAKKIFSLESSGVTGHGGVIYNQKRNILAAISLERGISYHLFNIDATASNAKDIVKLTRKSKWKSEHSTDEFIFITDFDLNPSGESIATITRNGSCSVSEVNTNNYGDHFEFLAEDVLSRCRWSTNIGEPLLFVKHGWALLDVLDVEKKTLILKEPIILKNFTSYLTFWIDVCPNNGNLLATAGADQAIRIFDKRESKIVKTFKSVHSKAINCVRWNSSGDMLASASLDKTAKLLDLKTGKVIYTGTTLDKNGAMSVCFV